METIVEISDELGLDYYYVGLIIRGNDLMIYKPKGVLVKYIEQNINLSAVDNITINVEKGVEKLIIDYNKKQYTFVNCGNNTVSYLKKKLQSSIKKEQNL